MGGGGGSKAPKPDPNVGIAALKSAETGERALEWSQQQAAITMGWAQEDRDRYKQVFEPLQDQFIAASTGYDTAARRDAAADRASTGVRTQAALSRGANERAMTAMGVRPGSGRFNEASRRGAMSEGLAAAGAANAERDRIEREGYARSANAVNLGSGMAVNPGTSAGLASGTANAGFDAAQRGYAQQGSLLNQDYQNRSNAWAAGQQASADLWSGLGSLAGVGLYAAMSDEEKKQNKRPARGALRAVEGMRVDEWEYKPGHGDEGRHIGTYAQDFQRETGRGDGKSINLIDAIGVTMGAVKELSGKVDDLAEGRGAFREVPK